MVTHEAGKLKKNPTKLPILYSFHAVISKNIQGVSGGIGNILGGGSMNYSQ
jgi:hypothetical protein